MGTETELRTLVSEYAAAVDDRDTDRLLALFVDDGELVVPGPRPWVLHGHDELVQIADGLEAFTKTLHFVGQSIHRVVGPDEATGQVACIAHHLMVDPGGETAKDSLWMMRYHDTYRRLDGTWLFGRRVIELLWTEERPADPPPPPEHAQH